MALRHVVLLTFVDTATDEQRQEAADELGRLPGLIDTIDRYEVGIDLGLAEGNASISVIADFADETAWRAYLDHPEHQRVVANHLRPILSARSATQFRQS